MLQSLLTRSPSRVWAYIISVFDPYRFFAMQVPNTPLESSDLQPQALVLSLQMGNVLLLLAAMAVICCWTPRPSTSRWYLVAVAFADYGHIYGTYVGMGRDAFLDVRGWNDAVWGSVGASTVLNIFRWLTVLGAFGGLAEGGEVAIVGTKKRV